MVIGGTHAVMRPARSPACFVAVGRRVGRPEMTAAPRADPELVGRPRHAGARVAHLHFGAAALTADVQVDVAHGRILAQGMCWQLTVDS